MKKLLFVFFLLMLLCFPAKSNAVVTNSSYSVKVNVFLKDDCEDCEKAKEWLEEYRKEKFIDVEYININDNNELYDKIKKELKIKNNKMPLTIIGSNYFIGFNNKMKESLNKAITAYDEVDNYCDIVSKTRQNEDVKECIKQNKDIYKANNFPTTIIVIVSLVILCSIIGINLIIKKKH